MSPMTIRTLALAAVLGAHSFLLAHAHEMVCAGMTRGMAAPVDSADFRKYAPDRTVDMLHIAIDVTPNFRDRSIRASTTLRFKPLKSGTREVRLNAQDLRVEKVTSTRAKLAT